MTDSYNGYTNYETWNICLWIDNEEGSQDYWLETSREIAKEVRESGDYDDVDSAKSAAVSELAARMESEFEEAMPDFNGFWNDILRTAFDRINWSEAAATRFDDDETFIETEE